MKLFSSEELRILRALSGKIKAGIFYPEIYLPRSLVLKKFLFSLFFISALIASLCTPSYAADSFDSAVFFGDSTTAHMAVRGGIPQSRVWSGKDSTVRFSSVNKEKCVYAGGVSLTLAEAVKKYRPPILVITVGVSGGAGVMSKDSFQNVYRQMLQSVMAASPDTQIYVQSILPLSDRSVEYYKKITKDAVLEANSWIREVCASLSVPYIDTHSLLTDENGYLKQEYQNDPYMHLTASAYKAIISNLRKNIKK